MGETAGDFIAQGSHVTGVGASGGLNIGYGLASLILCALLVQYWCGNTTVSVRVNCSIG